MRIFDQWNFAAVSVKPPDMVAVLKPANLHEEFEKWMASKDKSYNPKFVYDEAPIRKTLRESMRLVPTLAHLAEFYMEYDDWQAELTAELLISQVEDLLATVEILEAIVKGKGMDELDAPIDRLFGKPTLRELELSVKMTYERSGEILIDELIGDDEQEQFSREKLKAVATGFLRNFKGILTEEENDRLKKKRLREDKVVEILQKVVYYLLDNSQLDDLRVRFCISEEFDTFAVAPTTTDGGPFVVTVPMTEVSAAELLQTAAHELNTHLRVMAATAEMQDLVSPFFRPSMVSRTQRGLAQEGFAVLNGESCVGDTFCNWFEPTMMLAPLYARQGHNFAETAQFVYETYDIDPTLDDLEMHQEIWTSMQIFYGLEDTSAHANYALPWEQIYYLGPMRTLKELVRVDAEQFENPLSLMRYSELPLEFIPKINRIEKRLGQKLAPDPFECWDFANLNPDIPTPTEYCKHLLLEM